MDSATGRITGTPGFDDAGRYQITVTATDQENLSVSDSFELAVDDTNRAPTLIQLFGNNVEENAAGAEIGTLIVTDPDAGDTHTYTVDDARFEVVDDTLKLKAGVSLDHESDDGVAVEVTATDAGGLSYSESYIIAVTDNNEAPTDLELAGTGVDENLAGAIVGALTVTDPDVGDTHTLTVDDARFEVVDGALKLKDGASLDHEAEDTVTVEVTATDAGLEYRESFTIAVNDVNEAPRLVQQPIDQTYREGQFGGFDARLFFVDPDEGDELTYSVVNLPPALVLNSAGQAVGTPGFDDAGEYPGVVFTATDSGGLSVSADPITMRILDTNRDPIVQTPLLDVAARAGGSVSIDTAPAFADLDGDTLTFAAAGLPAFLAIDELTGQITGTAPAGSTDSFEITVTASDGRDGSVSDTFDLDLGLGNPPDDISLTSAGPVAENAPGAVIGTLAATDPDLGDTTFTFTTSDTRFTITGDQLALAAGTSSGLPSSGRPSSSRSPRPTPTASGSPRPCRSMWAT